MSCWYLCCNRIVELVAANVLTIFNIATINISIFLALTAFRVYMLLYIPRFSFL